MDRSQRHTKRLRDLFHRQAAEKSQFHDLCFARILECQPCERLIEFRQVGIGLVGRDVDIIERHAIYTKSSRAAKILSAWEQYVPKFVKVMPQDYARVLKSLKKVESQGLSGDEAIMAAFEENVQGGH